MKNFRIVTTGLAAAIVYFGVSMLVGILFFAVGAWINRGATGLTGVIAPFYVRGLAGAIGIYAGILTINRMLKTLPKRIVAIIIFSVLGAMFFMHMLPTLILIFMIIFTIVTNLGSSDLWTTIPPASIFWEDFKDGIDDKFVPFLEYGTITFVMVWRFLWQGRALR
jgi:hypothetical protein